MLQIVISPVEMWDEAKEEFVYTKAQTLQLEHSLVSLSKWESRWCKPFLTRDEKTFEEIVDYVRCMTLTQNVDPKTYLGLSNDNLKKIQDYIDAPMTATTFLDNPNEVRGRSIVTAEIIYYWMICFNIPVEFQKWHLNRLLTLIKVCERKSQKPKKRSMNGIMARNNELNAARRKKLKSKG